MKHKDIRYRRFERRMHIARKRDIAVFTAWLPRSVVKKPTRYGQLDKGKVHCSCPLCAAKSTKRFGRTYNSLADYTAKDRRKFDSMKAKLIAYYSEAA